MFKESRVKRIKHKANELLNRTLDQHINLAVTGLSRSGKTAFISSFVNQLLNEGASSQLPFFDSVHEGRFIAAKRVPQKHFHVSRFAYDEAMACFTQSDPSWPGSTNGISEIRLSIKYQPQKSLLKYATDSANLFIDITDYPGEWLLDLPMLNQTFEMWSEQTLALLNTSPRNEHAQTFLSYVQDFDPLAPLDEELVANISKEYTRLLSYFKNELGLSLIQPGRFILPAELEDAPILQFFPFTNFSNLEGNEYQNASDDTNIGMLRARFVAYKEQVVRKFYREHFVKFDRQIILADCLTPLNNGKASFDDLQQSLTLIMESFNYGDASLFSRLFAPKIDKLLFAATKADHVTPDQHPNLVSLLNQVLYKARNGLQYDGIKMKSLAMASVKATKLGETEHKGATIPVLQGKNVVDNKLITLYPGSVPSHIPHVDYWQSANFTFNAFMPLTAIRENDTLPHLRMDQVMQFLLGDKMK